MRKHGLACDNLVGADVVTVDGRFVHACADEHADLFWALRGGGGNFGVVTAFEYELHPVGPTVAAGAIFFKGEDAGQVARGWRKFLESAPDELTTMLGFAIAPPAPFLPESIHGKPVALVLAMHAGAVDDGLPTLDPLRRLAEPVADLLGPLPYIGMQSLVDALHPPGDGNYFKSHHLEGLPDDAIDLLLAGHASMPSPMCEIHVHDLRGAVAREPGGATAFPHRSAPMVLNVIGKLAGRRPRASGDRLGSRRRRVDGALRHRRRVRELPRRRRGPGPPAGGLRRRHLRPPRAREGRLGPGQPAAPQPERAAFAVSLGGGVREL